MGNRTISPDDVYKRVEMLIGEAGIISDIQRIDYKDKIGIPIYGSVAAAMPGTSKGLRIHGGKGITPDQARASAIGEAIERYSAGIIDQDKVISASFNEVRGIAIDPRRLFYSKKHLRIYSDDQRIDWSPG